MLRRRAWLLGAVLLVVVGTIGSVLGAQAVARNQAQQSRQRFVASARGIASTLTLALQHEQDLVLTVGTFVTLGPQVSQSTFQSWITSIHAFQRYPEVIGIADVALVPASGLSVFAAQSVADPAGPLGPGGTFQVSPAGNRPCTASSSWLLVVAGTTVGSLAAS